MQLNKQLVLFRYILHTLGYEAFEDLQDQFNNRGSSGRYRLQNLQTISLIHQ